MELSGTTWIALRLALVGALLLTACSDYVPPPSTTGTRSVTARPTAPSVTLTVRPRPTIDAAGLPDIGVSPDEAVIVADGRSQPLYRHPVQLVSGGGLSNASPEERSAAAAGIDENTGVKSRIDLEINGFRFYTADGSGYPPEKLVCQAHSWAVSELLRMDYLPQGTYTPGPQYKAYCQDGSLAFAGQEFRNGHFAVSFSTGFEPGGRIVEYWRDSTVYPLTIGGRESIVIIPRLPQYNPQSLIAIGTPQGLIKVAASALGVAELMKIASGITCDTC